MTVRRASPASRVEFTAPVRRPVDPDVLVAERQRVDAGPRRVTGDEAGAGEEEAGDDQPAPVAAPRPDNHPRPADGGGRAEPLLGMEPAAVQLVDQRPDGRDDDGRRRAWTDRAPTAPEPAVLHAAAASPSAPTRSSARVRWRSTTGPAGTGTPRGAHRATATPASTATSHHGLSIDGPPTSSSTKIGAEQHGGADDPHRRPPGPATDDQHQPEPEVDEDAEAVEERKRDEGQPGPHRVDAEARRRDRGRRLRGPGCRRGVGTILRRAGRWEPFAGRNFGGHFDRLRARCGL